MTHAAAGGLGVQEHLCCELGLDASSLSLCAATGAVRARLLTGAHLTVPHRCAENSQDSSQHSTPDYKVPDKCEMHPKRSSTPKVATDRRCPICYSTASLYNGEKSACCLIQSRYMPALCLHTEAWQTVLFNLKTVDAHARHPPGTSGRFRSSSVSSSSSSRSSSSSSSAARVHTARFAGCFVAAGAPAAAAALSLLLRGSAALAPVSQSALRAVNWKNAKELVRSSIR